MGCVSENACNRVVTKQKLSDTNEINNLRAFFATLIACNRRGPTVTAILITKLHTFLHTYNVISVII